MEQITQKKNKILEFFSHQINEKVNFTTDLPVSGSARFYVRIHTKKHTYIGTYNADIQENQNFFYLNQLLLHLEIKAPKVLNVNSDQKIYIQEDCGDTTLFHVILEKLSENKLSEAVRILEVVLIELLENQYKIYSHIDFNSLTNKNYTSKGAATDLCYFKSNFIDTFKLPFISSDLFSEFRTLAESFNSIRYQTFMFRDFQSRNIMLYNNSNYLIDFQGGRKGPGIYDAISLIYQAKLNLPGAAKNYLMGYFLSKLEQKMNFSKTQLLEEVDLCLLLRLMQVLGAYGLRGIKEKKPHFKESLFPAIQNLKLCIQSASNLNLKYLEKFFEYTYYNQNEIIWKKMA